MPGMLMHVGMTVQCMHMLGTATTAPTQTRVLVAGQPVATAANLWSVAGCPFTIPGPKPQPCVSVKWIMPATRVMIGGVPALLQTPPGPGPGAGGCEQAPQVPQAPPGPPVVVAMQVRAMGT